MNLQPANDTLTIRGGKSADASQPRSNFDIGHLAADTPKPLYRIFGLNNDAPSGGRSKVMTEGEAEVSVTREEIDAKIAGSEARIDTKFAQLLGELTTMRAEIKGSLDTVSARVEHVEKATAGVKTTVIVTAIAAMGLTVAIMAYGSQWFGLGMDAQQIAGKASSSAISSITPKVDALDARYNEMNGKLDQLLQATRPRVGQSSENPLRQQ